MHEIISKAICTETIHFNRKIKRIIAQESRLEILNTFVEKLKKTNDDVYAYLGWDNPILQVTVKHLKEVVPVLQELRSLGYKCKSYSDSEFSNCREFALEHKEDNVYITVKAVLGKGAACKFVEISRKTEEVVKYKLVCDNVEADIPVKEEVLQEEAA